MKYVRVPDELTVSDISANNACLSPGRYVRFIPPKRTEAAFVSLDKLVVLRTEQAKVSKADWYHYAEIGDIDVGTGGISFHLVRGYRLPSDRLLVTKRGDILVSTVRTYRKGIGCCSLDVPNMVTTKAVLNICDITDDVQGLTLPYLYSFLRSDFFTEQVWSMLNRGLYPRMDKGALDKIVIPVPRDERTIRWVSVLVSAMVDKEAAIRERDSSILRLIDEELDKSNAHASPFEFSLPTAQDIRKLGRLDAGIYDKEYKSKMHRILSYGKGTQTPTEMGFTITPGPSLEIKLLGTRIDSLEPRSGYYSLILPTNISEYGTLDSMQYMGTRWKLPLLKRGDIVFGEAGFQKGRSIVLVDAFENSTTNAHGICARREDGGLVESMFFRCIFNWYRNLGLVDLAAVGGSGGHLSPSYFDDFIHIPIFPDDKKEAITKLYHNAAAPPDVPPTMDTFVEWHRKWNESLGIWELDKEMKRLQDTLVEIQEQIINGEIVKVPLT